jgi:hypothetical protein
MKALFIEESKKNKNLPIGGGLWSTACSIRKMRRRRP